MNERGAVKVHIEFGDLKADFEGDANQVIESVLRFLSQICPNIDLLQKVTYTPDLVKLANSISGVIEILSEGPIVNPDLDLSARNAICLALLGAYVGNKIGRLKKDTLSTNELSRFTGKARKTISNEIPLLIENGIVERAPESEYRITQLGIRTAEKILEVIKGGLQSKK